MASLNPGGWPGRYSFVFMRFCALYAKHPGWGIVTQHFFPRLFQLQSPGSLCGTPQTHMPCGRKVKMAIPRCANEWSLVDDGVAWSVELSDAGRLGFAQPGLPRRRRAGPGAPRARTQ